MEEVHSQLKLKNGEIEISGNIKENYVQIGKTDYYLSYLDPRHKGNKGGNSFVFAMYDAQTYNEDSDPCKVIKIRKYSVSTNKQQKIILDSLNNRFSEEINALKVCKNKATGNVIEIFNDGIIWCEKIIEKKEETIVAKIPFQFYVMEYAKPDLKAFMEENNVSVTDRVYFCLQIALGLKQLNDLGYYHRDIKPDNIFVVDGTWKIGDLGLIAKRNSKGFDKERDFIGPRGWISPEVMNKYLSEGIDGRNFDCNIDHQSDLFQLGKVFWYILQGNAPIGCVERTDFIVENESLYSIVRQMLCHSKVQRFKTIEDVIEKLKEIYVKYLK